MIRTPRCPRLSHGLRALGDRIGGSANRKALAITGAGLALAGTGAATATMALTGSTASAAGTGSIGHVANAWHAAAHRAAVRHTTGGHTTGGHTTGRPGTGRAMHGLTWAAASKIAAGQTFPKASHGTLPARDRLTPAGTSGPQIWMPITPARYENARTIVRQALAKHMGVRAAVVAVATSMQESGLLNIGYGTSDSLGLFQQRPSCGWGTSAQILHPAYAADAFLGALRGYEAHNPGWAQQPLWESAQGVQNSGFPYAYAKWEAQAAHLVATITPHLV